MPDRMPHKMSEYIPGKMPVKTSQYVKIYVSWNVK
jgi:hypothetical protein